MAADSEKTVIEGVTVAPVQSKIGKAFIIEHHYSHGCHNGPMTYGMFRGNDLVGVCAFATPCSENVRASVFGPGFVDNVTELHRLVLLEEEPRNSESWFIVRALKLLKQRKPHIWAVLSFADATEGHVGTIYQATNAIFTGSSSRACFWVDNDGRLRHPRQNGHNITPAEAQERGWTSMMRDSKYRYLFLLGDSRSHLKLLREACKLPSLPYPKVLVDASV